MCLIFKFVFLHAGVKNVSGIKVELAKRLEQLKDLIPDKILPLPSHTYFDEPGKITNNEHKAVMQVIILDLEIVQCANMSIQMCYKLCAAIAGRGVQLAQS